MDFQVKRGELMWLKTSHGVVGGGLFDPEVLDKLIDSLHTLTSDTLMHTHTAAQKDKYAHTNEHVHEKHTLSRRRQTPC